MPYKRTPREAYNDQKKSALKRGIGWEFTFDQWENWWITQLGPNWFKKRGHFTGQYVMARNGDIGPYAMWNVRAALVEENHGEFNRNKPAGNKPHRKRLTPEIVKAIYVTDGLYADIAKQFSLDAHSVHRIKCQKCYKVLTENLERGRSG